MVKKIVTLISFLFILFYIVILLLPKINFQDDSIPTINVEIRGDIKENKKLNLELGSTFSDALDCIELTETSDISDYSLNMPLSNNMVINIRSKSINNKKISINAANIDELCALPGIGSKTAEKIIKYREVNGSFHYLEELMNVPGIGIKKYEKLKEYISL